jgi:hypothetical protein
MSLGATLLRISSTPAAGGSQGPGNELLGLSLMSLTCTFPIIRLWLVPSSWGLVHSSGVPPSRPLGGIPMSIRIFFVIDEACGCLRRRVSCHCRSRPRTSPKRLLSGQAERLRRGSVLLYRAHASRHGLTTGAALCPISSRAPTPSSFQLPSPRPNISDPLFSVLYDALISAWGSAALPTCHKNQTFRARCDVSLIHDSQPHSADVGGDLCPSLRARTKQDDNWRFRPMRAMSEMRSQSQFTPSADS